MKLDIPTILLLELFTSLIAAAVLTTAKESEDSSGLTEARGAMLALTPAFALQLARRTRSSSSVPTSSSGSPAR